MESRAQTLVCLILESFENELKEAFKHQDGLKVPTIEYEGKILYPCIMTKEPSFVYDDRGFYAPAPANIIAGKETDIKYLIALLNSKFIYFAMRSFYMGGGIEGELKTNNLLKLPIPAISPENEDIINQIITAVNIRIKQVEISNTLELDSQIDELVYRLYHLSDEEIAFMHSL